MLQKHFIKHFWTLQVALFSFLLVSANEFYRGTHACTPAIQCIFHSWKIDLECFAYFVCISPFMNVEVNT